MIDLKNYSNLFVLWILQSLIALVWLLLIPTESVGYSVYRALLMALLLASMAFFVVLAFKFRSVSWDTLSSRPRLYNFLYLVAIILFFFPPFVIVVLNALGQAVGNIYTSYAERIAPMAFLASATGLEWCIWHIAVKKMDFSNIHNILTSTLKIILLVLPIMGILFITKWGISPIRDGSFGNPPTPLLEWQIALGVLVGSAAMLTELNWKLRRLDVVLFFLVYLFACLIWLTDPLVPGAFATPPRAPNFEPYPFSDPQIYAQYGQSALVGNGFLWPDIPTRPFYVMLLTWMYAIVGQNYYHVIFLQTILLAFFPAVLYLLGLEFGSRPLGLSLALLAVLRDLTTNRAVPFASNYSYSKLFLSELPTGLFLVLFTIFVIKWMKSSKPIWFFLLMGGILGVAALIRLQSVVLLVPVAITTVFPFWKDRRLEWVKGLTVTTIGVALVFSPWLVRNYYAAGGFVIDNPISQSMVFARRWSGDNGNTSFPMFPGETTAQYVSRMNEIAIDSFKREPVRILNGITNHFFNNIISSLYTFPVRDRIESPAELLWPAHAFWQTGTRSPLLSMIYIVILAVGLAVAWIINRWIGLLPFILSLGYHAWTAIFLSSGDRFLIPIDWIWHVYFMLGLLTISKAMLSGIHDLGWYPLNAGVHTAIHSTASHWKTTAITAGLVLCVGLLLPLTEHVFPEIYPALTQDQLSTTLGITPHEDEIIVYGRAIYPRYYDAGDGEPDTAKLGYEVSDGARLVFWLVGPNAGLVIFPLETAPEFFPHASDVWIIGELDEGVLYARIIKVEVDGESWMYGR